MATKTIALMKGGDWYDACVTHLEVDENLDLKAEYRKYREWYVNEYSPAFRRYQETGGRIEVKYQNFEQWLFNKGLVTEADVEEVWEEDL